MPKHSFLWSIWVQLENIQEKMWIYICQQISWEATDYCDPVDEEVLVNVCLYGMLEEYHIFLGNLPFPSFSRLM